MKHAADILLGIRFGLDLYINFRPIKLYDERLCPLRDKGAAEVDFVIFRENTEGAYVNVGGFFKRGTPDEVAVQEEIHTRKGVERIIRAAFDYAVAHRRREVCMADKSNVMRYGHDLWQRTFAEVASEYPGIAARHLFVDALAMQLVRKPETFDVIVTNNMFGDIVTDLGAALQGGLGMAASGNLHPGRTSMFEPVHGSAPKYAGTGRANPFGAVLSAGLMLETLGHDEAAAAIETAVRELLREGRTTVDVGGTLTTSEVGDELARRLAAPVATARLTASPSSIAANSSSVPALGRRGTLKIQRSSFKFQGHGPVAHPARSPAQGGLGPAGAPSGGRHPRRPAGGEDDAGGRPRRAAGRRCHPLRPGRPRGSAAAG